MTHKSGKDISSTIRFGDMSDADRAFAGQSLQKGASRRQVMGWLMAMGATATSAGAIVASATEAAAATPKRGGKIRAAYAQHGPADTLDPILQNSSIDYVRGRLHYNGLTRMQEDLTAGPELAHAFEANQNATEWTFELRKDVEFHDGSKLTADDVIYSMRRHMGDDTKSLAAILVKAVTGWVKVDAHTVKAVLSEPQAELPIILATYHFKIVKDGTTDFSAANGTGPFRLKEFIPGVRSVALRNDNYWGSEGPYLDEIETFAITDPVARVNALVNGDVQIMSDLDTKSMGQVEAAAGVEPYIVSSGAFNGLSARYDNSPAADAEAHYNFLKGMKHLQRRDRIRQVVNGGLGDIGNDQPIGPAYGASWCKEINDPVMHPYDLDKAKHYFKKSGLTGAELSVAEVSPGLTDMAVILQREASKAGFDLQLKRVPTDGYWGAVWNKAPFFVTNWNARPTANIMMSLANASDAKWNESAWKNESFDKILKESRGVTDPAKRYEMNCELQRLCADGSGTIIPTHAPYKDAVASNLRGLTRVPLGPIGGSEWPEYVWLDS